jgi:diphosphomevalonate decarboxylase
MNQKMKATAIANSNIALVKYWGKRDQKLTLPQNSSICMVLDKLYTTTTTEFSKNLKNDTLTIDGKKASPQELERTAKHLDIIREMAGKKIYARIESKNNFPKSAGLASSASGFAALTLSATKAIGLELDEKELSIIARQGSGSAARSIPGGFVELTKGTKNDGSDCFAFQIAPKEHWPELTMIVAVITEKEKQISSTKGMEYTVATSPLYKAWLETIEEDLEKTRKAIKEKNLELLGKTAEMNCLKMHSTMITTEPHIIYWEPETIKLMKEVMKMRSEGINCYFTIDGGPQVKIICLDKDRKTIEKRIKKMKEVKAIYSCHAGDGARIEKKGLF